MEAALEQEAKALTDFADAYSELSEEEIAENICRSSTSGMTWKTLKLNNILKPIKLKKMKQSKKLGTGENGDDELAKKKLAEKAAKKPTSTKE